MMSPKSLNVLAAMVHTGLLVGFWVLFQNKLPKSRETISLYRVGLDGEAVKATPPESEMDSPQIAIPSGKVNIRQLVLAFFGVTAVAHTLYATDFFGAGWYSAAIARGWNPYRWVEYGISASIMSVLVSSFSGVREISAVGLIAGGTAAMQGCGFLVERALSAKAPDYTAAVGATVVGWLLLVAAWAAILRSFALAVTDVNEANIITDGKKITLPSWLWGIGVVQAVFFSSFGLVQLAHARGVARASASGKRFNFAGTESAYLALSLAAKATLGGVIAYGLVGRNEE